MAERIDFTKIDKNDPRFLQIDPDNPNTNISGSRFDPTDPTADVKNPASASARYNQFLQTANVGDTFDFGDGTKNKFVGFNQMGTPIIQTIESPGRQDWRGTMSGATSFADAVNKLKAAGFDNQTAQFLVTQSGTDFADQGKYMAANAGAKATQIGAMADGTPIYGFDGQGKPVTTPTGTIYSTVSAADAVAKFNSGNKPVTGSGALVTNTATTNSNTNPFVPGSDAAKAWNERKSAYDLLYSEFNKYGLGTLVEPLKNLVQEGVSPSEFSIQLRNTPQYQKRFAANAKRVQSGLKALSEAEYIGLEDQYQNIMRNYGLPEQYYARGDLGVQQGFEQFIGNDVSPVELEDRIQTAERRVRYANPEVGIALKTFYPDITNGDVLAYALDPKTALESLKRRITAAEVGSTAVQMGLATNVTDAEYLARYGVTKAQAQQGYQTIANILPRASMLSDIYATQGVNPYTQATAEKEVFGVPGAAEAAAQRKKIVGLEQAAFSGSSGAAGGALARERAGGF